MVEWSSPKTFEFLDGLKLPLKANEENTFCRRNSLPMNYEDFGYFRLYQSKTNPKPKI
jgi:hypothetical protein